MKKNSPHALKGSPHSLRNESTSTSTIQSHYNMHYSPFLNESLFLSFFFLSLRNESTSTSTIQSHYNMYYSHFWNESFCLFFSSLSKMSQLVPPPYTASRETHPNSFKFIKRDSFKLIQIHEERLIQKGRVVHIIVALYGGGTS